MGAFMADVMQDPHMRALGKDVQNFAGKLPGVVTQLTVEQKSLLAHGVDEAQVLAAAAPFLAAELGLPVVTVHRADDPAAPPHAKKNVAAPLKPGIALA